MTLAGNRTYVGFGFGAIQAGLFLYEAFRSGTFGRLVVAEVMPDVVMAVRQANGHFSLNIAHPDRIEHSRIGPIEIDDPALPPDRQRLVQAIAEADEIGTAIPSVSYYVSEGAGSLHRILGAGLRKKVACRGPRAVIYTAENHNHAAEILEAKVLAEIPKDEQPAVQARVRFLNTVIGKMSGIIADPAEIQKQDLMPITPNAQRAFLVESFNRILISKIQFDEAGTDSFRRGIGVFEEKENLLPFEEAKLYGHNATHSLAAYIGAVKGVPRMAGLSVVPGVLPFLRAAFIEESGQALIRKYEGIDPLFTSPGYAQYAGDLLNRMTNPYLLDTIERVGRDPERKLGWDDRLIGTIRLALSQDIKPRRYALGAAAVLTTMSQVSLSPDRFSPSLGASAEALLGSLWRQAAPAPQEQEVVLNLIDEGQQRLNRWQASGFQNLEKLF
jgi:mannitol-1-phosphate 5-dehydrogenase